MQLSASLRIARKYYVKTDVKKTLREQKTSSFEKGQLSLKNHRGKAQNEREKFFHLTSSNIEHIQLLNKDKSRGVPPLDRCRRPPKSTKTHTFLKLVQPWKARPRSGTLWEIASRKNKNTEKRNRSSCVRTKQTKTTKKWIKQENSNKKEQNYINLNATALYLIREKF